MTLSPAHKTQFQTNNTNQTASLKVFSNNCKGGLVLSQRKLVEIGNSMNLITTE